MLKYQIIGDALSAQITPLIWHIRVEREGPRP